jgi:hypothetical protein
MDQFGYLSVLYSIILGLAITQILQGFRGLVLSRANIRLYAPTVQWAILLLIIDVQSWWALFGLRNHHEWTFLGFSVVLLQSIVLYMLAALVFPDLSGERTVVLRTHYYAHVRWFFGLSILIALVSLAKDLVIDGHLTERANLIFHAAFILFMAAAALTRREWYHRLLPILTFVGIGAYIATLFSRLR